MYLTKNSKSPFYQIVFLQDGKQTTKSTKKKLKSEALKFLSEFEKHIESKPKIKSIRLNNYEAEYIEYLSGQRAKSYIRNIKLAFNKLQNEIKNKPINEITVKEIDSFISKTFIKAPYSALSYYRSLKAAFNIAVRWKYIFESPVNSIKPPKVKKSLPVFLTHQQLDLILENTQDQLLKDIFIFGFNTGMRISEIMNLTWNSVSLAERIIKVEHTETFTTKSKKERIIPINKTLFELLSGKYPKIRKLNNKKDFVFYRKTGIKLNSEFISKQFKKAVRASGLSEKYHFHNLRHSFASNLVQAGCSLLTVQQLLGHENYRTTEIYSHLQHSNLSDAVALLDRTKQNKENIL